MESDLIRRGYMLATLRLNGIDTDGKDSTLIEASEFVRVLKEAPAVDAEPVRRGEWIVLARFLDTITTQCPYCGEEYSYKFGKLEHIGYTYAKYNFCPNCGARLDLEGDANE